MDTSEAAAQSTQHRPSPAEYRATLREHLAPLRARTMLTTHLPLVACAGSVLAEELRAPVDLPLFVNSQMDGYAVHSADVAGASTDAPVRLTVTGTTMAGSAAASPIGSGQAQKVMTGSAVPEGADCVVPVEDTQPDGSTILVVRPREAGEFFRRPGDDVRADDPVLPAGVQIAARHLAAAASLGVSGLDVRPRPQVAVIATGAELVAPGRPVGPGQIWESNSVTLAASLEDCGCTVSTTLTSSDDPQEFAAALDTACTGADLVVTAGAVSMGDAEVVRQLLGDREGSRFAPIAMQPGGPQGLATWRGTPVVCLPGNPVSALVSFIVLLRPLILEAVGRAPSPVLRGRLARAVDSPAGRAQYLRASFTGSPESPDSPNSASDGPPVVEPVSGPGSHLVALMARAEVLVEIPANVTALPAGAEVDVLPL